MDNFRKSVESGKDMLTLFNLNGTYAGIAPATFLDECEISEHGKRASDGTQLVLPRSEELATLFIQIGSIMQNAASQKELLIDGNKITVRKKDEDEYYDFNWDYDSVLFKYLDFVRKTLFPQLILSKDESKLLIKTIHAAYYIAGEKGEISELFEKHYEQYFREKN